MPGPLTKEELSLSQSACAMLQVLSARLNHARTTLAGPLFLNVRSRTIALVDSFLYDEVICQNKFSIGGAQQLQYDYERGLIPLFQIDEEEPCAFKKLVLSHITLINLTFTSFLF